MVLSKKETDLTREIKYREQPASQLQKNGADKGRALPQGSKNSSAFHTGEQAG